MHTTTRRLGLLALASFALLLATTPASGSPVPQPDTSVELRLAAIFGAAEAGTQLPDDLSQIRVGIEETLEDWDLAADFTELRRVLRLAELQELMRWSSTSQGPTGGVTTRLSDTWRLVLTYDIDEKEAIVIDMQLYRHDELVSAPRVRTVLGERAILSTAQNDGTFLFIVVEANRASLSEVTNQMP